MNTGTIVTMVTIVVTVATVSLITLATLVAVCPRTLRKGLASRTFSDLLFVITVTQLVVNPLKPELNPIYYLLALLAYHFLHVSRIRVKSLTLRSLTLYIYGAPILDVSRSHTTTQHSR
jgi:uncharacterized membrane protein YcaP (DUF421 family)